jgi:hypothetical protein
MSEFNSIPHPTPISARIKAMEGQRFGRLTVLGCAGHIKMPDGRAMRMWDCICDCGRRITARQGNIRAGGTTSCGCIGMEQRRAKVIDLAGQRFGRLVVVARSGSNGRGGAMWLCRCDCGQEKVVSSKCIRTGETSSCGCLQKDANVTHRMSYHPAYRSWAGMCQRCTNPKTPYWHIYGGRGITVCERWMHSFEAFWEDNPGWHPGLSLDRIDNDGNYEPGNVRWATDQQQGRNRSVNVMVETPLWGSISITEAAERAGLGVHVIRHRLKKNWPADRLFEPVNR